MLMFLLIFSTIFAELQPLPRGQLQFQTYQLYFKHILFQCFHPDELILTRCSK